jgi:hypothetical protein
MVVIQQYDPVVELCLKVKKAAKKKRIAQD